MKADRARRSSAPNKLVFQDIVKSTAQRPLAHIPLPRLTFARAAEISDALGLHALSSKIDKLSPKRLQKAIAETERRQHRKIDAALALKLSRLEEGKTEMVAIDLIRPGQVQISYA